MTVRYARPGRPRHIPDRSALSPRDQILDGAAHLFVTRGFAATSTREIADRAGMRQASLYYHFAGKDDILAELLTLSVRPTVDKIAHIESLVPLEDHATALYLLALADVDTLNTAPHNIGSLYGNPDVTSCEACEEFRGQHNELKAAYQRLGAKVTALSATSGEVFDIGEILMQVVETVVKIRSEGRQVDAAGRHALAAACLRQCGLDEGSIIKAADTAARFTSEVQSVGSGRDSGIRRPANEAVA